MAFDDGLIDLSGEYVILTDGDLEIDDGFLDEQLKILENNKDLFCVAQSLKMHNLPISTFSGAKQWIPDPVAIHPDYIETFTGGHMMLIRNKDFCDWISYRKQNDINFIDTEMHKFSSVVLGKKWGRTARTSSTHLTWDLYQDIDHPYTQFRLEQTGIWSHSTMSTYSVYEKK